jgi:DNA-binding MarR family transcriptional regulator
MSSSGGGAQGPADGAPRRRRGPAAARSGRRARPTASAGAPTAASTERAGRSRGIGDGGAVVRVDDDFELEYPGASGASTECYTTLCRTGDLLWRELERRIGATFGVNQTVALALAVLDGAGQPLTPSQIGERVLVASATMTATLDALESRGWARRMPHPDDRRSVLVEVTAAGRAVADQLLPGIHAVERRVMSALTPAEHRQLLTLLGKVSISAAAVAAEDPAPLQGERARPRRLR